jgi:glutathione synthase/RimK-type ligase-like ATP-grasp enzyme
LTVSLAIADRPGSFSDRWLARAADLGVAHERVDGLDSRIVSRLRGHDAFLWHFTHSRPADLLVARAVIAAAEELGLLCFPGSDTCRSFDDKLAQKYQLEALGAPLAQSDCFFSEESALAWLETARFPLVMKLRGGAGSSNVRLVRRLGEARALTRRAFGRGLETSGVLPTDAVLRLQRARGRRDLAGVLLRAPRTLLDHWRRREERPRERGYVYFQEFLPGNAYDVRVTVIGKRAFAFTRNVRRNDFRASGSGSLDYARERIPEECLRIAFRTAAGLRSQSAAFDLAFDAERRPRILEVSYGYLAKFVHDCPGHWDESLRFVEGHVWPQDAILDDLLAALATRGRARPSGRAAR